MDLNNYFTHEALARFVTAQGKTVEKIICHLWQNTFDNSGTVEIIDNVELHFTDGHKLTISCNENGDGLDAINFDYKKTAKDLHKEFEGKIKLFSVNASATEMWVDVIGKTLENVKIVKEGEYHQAGSVLLELEKEKRIISISPLDGLVIDYYEED
jgi:hypothetical protein